MSEFSQKPLSKPSCGTLASVVRKFHLRIPVYFRETVPERDYEFLWPNSNFGVSFNLPQDGNG